MSDCSCVECCSACKSYPGWMNFEEAKKAIDAGLANKLMLDYYTPDARYGNSENIWVLCPAIVGYEGKEAASWPEGKCTFFKNKKCTIHSSGFKPQQCRSTFICKNEGDDKKAFLPTWDTPKAKALIEQWRHLVESEHV